MTRLRHAAGIIWVLGLVSIGSGCDSAKPSRAWGTTHLGTRLPVGPSDLYYTPELDPVEVVAATQALTREKFLGERPCTAQLRCQNRRYEARFVVHPGAEADPLTLGWRRIGEVLSRECFRAAPVDIHLCDDQMVTLRVIPFEPVRPNLPVRVTFRPSVVGGSLVARFQNDSDRYLSLAVALTNPTTKEAKAVAIDVGPRQTTEHGWAEGWAYMSGETIAASHADYETSRLVVP